jgi:hypothetical protein
MILVHTLIALCVGVHLIDKLIDSLSTDAVLRRQVGCRLPSRVAPINVKVAV